MTATYSSEQNDFLSVAFVDTSVTQSDVFLQAFDANRVVMLDTQNNGVEQISQILEQYDHSLLSVHIFSGGGNGSIELGNVTLDQSNLSAYQDALVTWGSAFTENGDLLFYNSNLAADSTGQSFVEKIGLFTQTDIAASNDLTGNEALGGDWDLEFTTGEVETVFFAEIYLDLLASNGGNGLKAEYYDNSDFTNLKLTRTDATVDFNWQRTAPNAAIQADSFSVRWTGQIEPRYSETYTFRTTTDDGVRLWVNEQLIIDKFVAQSATNHTGTITLEAGKKYDIRMDYYEGIGKATAKLYWSSASQPLEIVPESQLFSSNVVTANPIVSETPVSVPSPVASTSSANTFSPSSGNGNGLKAEYYDNSDFTNLKLTRTDATVDFNWQRAAPNAAIQADSFSVRWTGQIEPRYSETYTFRTTTDDGVRLWVNEQLIIDKFVAQSATNHTGTITLEAGKKYDIRMDYYEGSGKATAKLYWSSASQPLEIVPESQLFSSNVVTANPIVSETPVPVPSPVASTSSANTFSPSSGNGNGLKAEYYDNSDFTNLKLTRTDATVDFNWQRAAPNAAIQADSFSVRWTGQIEPRYSETYTFRTTTDDGVRLWVNEQLIIDKFVAQSATNHTGTITLEAGKKYDIRMDYYEGSGKATAKLYWSSASQPLEIVPESQLFSSNVVTANPIVSETPVPVPSPVASTSSANTFSPSSGNGNGLKAEYYDNSDFTNLKLTRTDATVDFNWQRAAPNAAIQADSFSVRWTGQIEPRYSETYTFRTTTDDGVRLWVNEQLIIDKFVAQSATNHTGTITLEAGKKYDIRMDYYEGSGKATAKLYWSSASQPLEIVPESQLFSGTIETSTVATSQDDFGSSNILDIQFESHTAGQYTSELIQEDWKNVNWSSTHNRAHIVADPDGERGQVLEITYPKGSIGPSQGGAQFEVAIPESEELWLSYYVKFAENFDFRNGGKLPGLTSGGSKFTGSNVPRNGEGWSARYMWQDSGDREVIAYVYHIDQPNDWGDNIQLDGFRFSTGEWHQITQHIKLNTNNQANGVLETWVDGQKYQSRSDMRWRLGNQGLIDSFYFSTFHGGSQSFYAPRVNSKAYFDGFVISHEAPASLVQR